MGHVPIPLRWKEFMYHRGCSFNVNPILQAGLIAGGKDTEEGRQTVFFTRLDFFLELASAQEKRLKFWQTRSHAVIVDDPVPAECIEKVISMQGRRNFISETFHASSRFLKDAWKFKQQQQGTLSGTGKPVAEENSFKVDHKMQCSKIKEECQKFKNW